MAGLELVLIALLPLALLVGFVESRSDDEEEAAEAAPEAEEVAVGDLLDMLEPEEGAALRGGATLAEGAVFGFEAGPSQGDPPAGGPDDAPVDAPDHAPDHAAGSPEFEGYLRPEAILGSSGPDSIAVDGPGGAVVFANGLDGASEAGNLVEGGAGDDTLLGGAGADTLYGGDGANVIRASYDPNLEIAQGCDLFEWRDNGLPDLLEGGAGDDRLIFARGDTATGGGGSNVFEVWHDPWGSLPAAVVTDFTPGQDRLDLVVRIDEADHPDCGAWGWDRAVQAAHFEGVEPTIHPDEAAGHTEIRLGEQTLARLTGTPAITAADIRLFAFWDITT